MRYSLDNGLCNGVIEDEFQTQLVFNLELRQFHHHNHFLRPAMETHLYAVLATNLNAYSEPRYLP